MKGRIVKKKKIDIKNKIRNKILDFLSRFNSTAVLLFISPFFVLAILNEAYMLAVVLFIVPILIVFIRRNDHYMIFIPSLVYAFYQFVLMIVVPFFIKLYNYIEIALSGTEAILVMLLVCIAIVWLAMKVPTIKLWKLGRVNLSIVLAKGLGTLLIIFILEPIISLIAAEDLNTLADTWADPNVTSAIWLSVSMAFLATLASVILGIPLGYLLARRDFAGRSVIQGIVDIPIVIPHTVAGIALLTVFGVNGIIGAPLEELDIRFIDAWPGIVIAMMFVSAPFVINSARDGFAAVDPRFENVARSLGANRIQAFSKVSFRLSFRSIISGAIMSWARAISEFGAIIILVYFPMVAPTLIYDRFTSFGLMDSRPIAVLLVLVCLFIFITLRIFSGTGSVRQRHLPRGGGV